MRNRKLLSLISIVGLILVIVCLPLFGGCEPQAPNDTQTPTSGQSSTPTENPKFTIGVLSCLTDWFAPHDIIEWQECQMAAEMLNDRGGIVVDGQQYDIEVITEDCKSSLDGVTAAARKLIYEKDVDFLVGPGAFFPSAVGQLCAEAGVLDAISYCTNMPGQLSPDTPYTFLGYSGALEYAAACISYLHKNYPEVKTAALVIPDDGSLEYLTPPLTKLLADVGVEVVGSVGYANDTLDFNPIAAKLAAFDADCVFEQNGLVQHAGNLLKGLRELGYDKLFVCSIATSAADVMVVAGPDASTNFYCLGSAIGDPGTPAQMTELQQRLTDLYGTERSFFLQMANCVWEIPQVVEKAQSFDPAVVKDTWENMDSIETLFGTGHMGGLETYGINHVVAHPMPIEVLTDGEISFGGWETFEVK